MQNSKIKTYTYPLLFCFFYACTDELHQYFIPERASKFTDVIIDCVGAFIGIMIYNLINKFFNNKKTVNTQRKI